MSKNVSDKSKNVSGDGGDSGGIICPCCGKLVGMEHFSCESGSKGGKSGKGAVKARSSEQARKASEARWAKKRKVESMSAEAVELNRQECLAKLARDKKTVEECLKAEEAGVEEAYTDWTPLFSKTLCKPGPKGVNDSVLAHILEDEEISDARKGFRALLGVEKDRQGCGQ